MPSSAWRTKSCGASCKRVTATSEILGVISSSPTDVQPVLDVVAENAARLCDAIDAVIHRVQGEALRMAAHYGEIPIPIIARTLTLDRNTVVGRAVVDRQTLHIHDIAAIPESELPARPARQQGTRTMLAMPLLREGTSIGAILIRRDEVRPFSDKQIALLKTFADQAVIAIENVRLFQELEARNRDLTEALEQQTATSEILGVISSSPTDVQPVFEAIVGNAARLCAADQGFIFRFDGEVFRAMADYGVSPDFRDFLQQNPIPLGPGSSAGRDAVERRTVHIHDVLGEPGYQC